MKKPDGGAAFPQGRPEQGWPEAGDQGMSRRQWLAGLAMQGFIVNPRAAQISLAEAETDDGIREAIARYSYDLADAMLAFEVAEEKP